MVRKGIKNGLTQRDRRRRRTASSRSTPTTCTGTARRRCRGATSRRCSGCSATTAKCSPSSTPTGSRCRSVLCFYFRDEVLPYYAGDAVAARDLAANDFKYWELMRRACERGLQDCSTTAAASAAPGSFDFKKNWGFEPQPLHYEYRLYRRRCDAAEQSAQPEVPGAHRGVAAPAAAGRQSARPASSCEASAESHARSRTSLLFLVHRLPLSAEQGRQGALVPPAQAPRGALPRVSRHLRRRPGRLAARRGAARGLCADVHVEPIAPRSSGCAAPRACLRGEALTLPLLPQPALAAVGGGRHRGAQRIHARRRLLVADGAVRARPARRALLRRLRRRRFGEVGRSTRGSVRGRSRCLYRAKARRLLGVRAQDRVARGGEHLRHRRGRRSSSARPRPNARARVVTIGNGVDSDYFSPSPDLASPFAAGERADRLHRRDGLLAERRCGLVVRPRGAAAQSARRDPAARFYIVGMNPDAGGQGAGEPSRRCRRDRTRRRRSRRTCSTRAWSSRRCAWRAASRTRCSRRWRWRGRSS